MECVIDQRQFFDSMDTAVLALKIFDDIPDILFWIKDSELRLVSVNTAFVNWVNLPFEQIIGFTDRDFYYTDLADVFMRDDARVIQTGQEIRNKAELCANRFGGVEWRLTSKFPVQGQAGQIIGTTGISRPLQREDSRNLPQQHLKFAEIVDYVRGHMGKEITVEKLASFANMTIATLERRFNEYLGITPQRFLLETRMAAAAKLLQHSPLPITEIAYQVGYQNNTSFSRAFKNYTGKAPSLFRKRS